jgi:ABC-type transport system involved in Fe-S cluster assembly fused permease/ATPase subunit
MSPVRVAASWQTYKGRVELRDVTFGYDPYTPVLKNVSLTIEPGQFVGDCRQKRLWQDHAREPHLPFL